MSWKHQKIGNGHLSSSQLLQFLVAGHENMTEISSIMKKFTDKPSLLRKQLDALIGKIMEDDVKKYIKEVSESLPINVNSQ